MNMKYLKACVPEIETKINNPPAFLSQPVDMIYLGPMTENQQELVISKLLPFKSKIEEFIQQGVIFLFRKCNGNYGRLY